jgi:replicative DNA helicase
VLDPNQLLQAYDHGFRADALGGSGLAGLDELTGGLLPGTVWVITGGVGEGKSTLLTQWAAALARSSHVVQLVCPREPAAFVASRVLAQLSGLLVGHLDHGEVAPHDLPRLHQARELLGLLPLTVFARGGSLFTPEVDPYEGQTPPVAVLLDDADTIAGVSPARVAEYAAGGRLVVLTLPRTAVLQGTGDFAPVRERWGRISDVVIEARHHALSDLTEATGETRPATLRPGEADLVVHRNRWGPTRTLHAAFQGHKARFVDLAPTARLP